jgi:hypothetical protein
MLSDMSEKPPSGAKAVPLLQGFLCLFLVEFFRSL